MNVFNIYGSARHRSMVRRWRVVQCCAKMFKCIRSTKVVSHASCTEVSRSCRSRVAVVNKTT